MVTETSKLKLPDGKEYTWWELKPLMLQMPYTTWKEIKKFIIDVCKVNDMCTEVTHWQRAVDDIDEWMNKNVDPSLSDPCIGVNCNAGKK